MAHPGPAGVGPFFGPSEGYATKMPPVTPLLVQLSAGLNYSISSERSFTRPSATVATNFSKHLSPPCRDRPFFDFPLHPFAAPPSSIARIWHSTLLALQPVKMRTSFFQVEGALYADSSSEACDTEQYPSCPHLIKIRLLNVAEKQGHPVSVCPQRDLWIDL